MICKLFLQVILDDAIPMIRVPLSHGALCRTELFESADRLLLPMQIRRTRGSIAKPPIVSSKMSGWANDSDRCFRSYRRVQEIAFRWSAKTGQTRKPHTAFSITTESVKRRFCVGLLKGRAIELLRQTGRSW